MNKATKIVFEYSEGYFLAYRPIIRISISKDKLEYYATNDSLRLKLVYKKTIDETTFNELLTLTKPALSLYFQVLGRKSWTRIALYDDDENYVENYVSFNFALLDLNELKDYLIKLLNNKDIPPFLL